MIEEKKISISIDGNPLHSFLQVMLKQVINDHHYFEISLDIEVGEAYATHSLEKAKNWLGKKVVIQMGENTFIIRKTKCSCDLERNVLKRKTKRYRNTLFPKIFSTSLRRFLSYAKTGSE